MFERKSFLSAAGLQLSWKIECDYMSNEDWACLAYLAASGLEPFSSVIGVPTGGERFATALRSHATVGARRCLIADDVWTTGSSMRRVAEDMGLDVLVRADYLINWAGVVVFARGETPANVSALFTLGPKFQIP